MLRTFWRVSGCFSSGVFMLTCSLDDYGRSASSGVSFYVGPVGGSGFFVPYHTYGKQVMALVFIWILCVKQILVVVCIIVRLLVVVLCWNFVQLSGDSVLEVFWSWCS